MNPRPTMSEALMGAAAPVCSSVRPRPKGIDLRRAHRIAQQIETPFDVIANSKQAQCYIRGTSLELQHGGGSWSSLQACAATSCNCCFFLQEMYRTPAYNWRMLLDTQDMATLLLFTAIPNQKRGAAAQVMRPSDSHGDTAGFNCNLLNLTKRMS